MLGDLCSEEIDQSLVHVAVFVWYSKHDDSLGSQQS
jgi:hypothetical protein